MISLKQSAQVYDIALIGDLKLTVKPLKTLDMAIAQTAAKRRVQELESSARLMRQSGFAPEIPIDTEDEDTHHALYMSFLIKELALRHIVAWEGVEAPEGGTTAPLTPENINALMEVYPVGELFYTSLTLKHYLLTSAKEE